MHFLAKICHNIRFATAFEPCPPPKWRIHDFPDRGCQPLNLGQNLLFDRIIAENCMKMKEIGPRDGACVQRPGKSWIRNTGLSLNSK